MRAIRAFALAGAMAVTASCGGTAAPPQASPLAPYVPPAGTYPWLFVSDLHFDPFADPSLVDRLAATPPAGWAAVFASDGERRAAGAGHDTNAALLDSSIAAMRRVDPDPRVVVIAGDFLAHRFEGLYRATRTVHLADAQREDAAYDAFIDATIAYLADAFDRAFPHARFLVTIGNNDGYCGDYLSTPHSPFLLKMAKVWEPLVDRAHDVPDFLRSFPNSGAYVARLPVDGDLRVLVTNSVIWSTDYGNECAHNDDRPRAEQVAWMTAAAASGTAATRWWLLTHIPPGIDSFASLRLGRPTTMYKAASTRDLEALRLSGGHGFALIVSGHTHASAFRTVTGAGGPGAAPVTIVPSITPVNGNDPAFAVAAVARDGTLVDEVVYAGLQPVAGGMPVWHRSYGFDEAFGATRFDAAAIERARMQLERDLQLRGLYYGGWFASGGISGALELAVWRREWCAIDVTPAGPYERCLAGRR